MIEVLQKLISEKFSIKVLRDIVQEETGWKNAIPKRIVMGESTEKGESYLSVVTRFTVEVSQGEGEGDEIRLVHMIAKGLPDNIARRKSFRSVDFFRNEVAFYTKVWPALEEFQKSRKVSSPFNAIPKCLATYSDGLHDFIIMKDLTYDGFSSIPRTTDVDFDGAVQIFEVLGKFHALSFVFNIQDPTKFETAANSLKETYFDEKFRNWYTPIMSKMFWILRDAVERELSLEYLDRLDDLLKEDIFGKATKECKDRSWLCGISHGDCWTPNILIKSKDGATEIKIIDYQLARCASVIIDLSCILYICVDPLVRDSCWEELLKEYQRCFAAALREYGADESLITVDLIKENMRGLRYFIFAMCLEGTVMSGVEEVADLDAIQEETTIDNVWILKLITNPERRRALAGLFKHVFDHHFA